MQTCVVHYTCHSFEKWNEIQDYHSYQVYFLTIAKRSQYHGYLILQNGFVAQTYL